MKAATALSLQGRRVLVVGGGGGGVGHAISVAAAAAGATVSIVDASEKAAKSTAQMISETGGAPAKTFIADVRNGEQIDRAVADACSEMGGIDAMVASLGGLMAFNIPFVRLHEFSDDDWDKVFDLNIRYVFRFLRPVLKVLVEQGTGGAIVTVGSDGGTAGHGSPLNAAYGAAKSGLAHLTKTLALEYGRDGIRANMVSPGPTATSNVSSMSAEVKAGLESMIPLGHQGTSENIADAVVFMLSEAAAHVSGQILGVDGGLSVQRPAPAFKGIYGDKASG